MCQFSIVQPIITICKRSCGKVKFLHLSVILFTGGCRPSSYQTPPPGRYPLADTPFGQSPLGRYPSWQAPHCSGQYTSYLNAFLLNKWFTKTFTPNVSVLDPCFGSIHSQVWMDPERLHTWSPTSFFISWDVQLTELTTRRVVNVAWSLGCFQWTTRGAGLVPESRFVGSCSTLQTQPSGFVVSGITHCKRMCLYSGITSSRQSKALFTRTANVTIFVPFKNGFNAVMCCCLYITLKRSKVTLTVRVNRPQRWKYNWWN